MLLRLSIACLLLCCLTATAGRLIPRDPFEPDNTVLGGQANFLIDGQPQSHWFHSASDVDWYVLDAFLGEDNIVEIGEILAGRVTPELTLNVRVYDAANFCFGFCINVPIIEQNQCGGRTPPAVGAAVAPINLTTRNGLLASAVFISVRDCYGVANDELPYQIELLDRPDPPPPEQCQQPGACVPRALSANVTGTVIMQGSGEPVGGVLVQTDTNLAAFSKPPGPFGGQFKLLVEAGAGASAVTLSAFSPTLTTIAVNPALLGPYAEGQVVTGVEVFVGPGDGVFGSGFEL